MPTLLTCKLPALIMKFSWAFDGIWTSLIDEYNFLTDSQVHLLDPWAFPKWQTIMGMTVRHKQHTSLMLVTKRLISFWSIMLGIWSMSWFICSPFQHAKLFRCYLRFGVYLYKMVHIDIKSGKQMVHHSGGCPSPTPPNVQKLNQ